jgi:hypothetical protein
MAKVFLSLGWAFFQQIAVPLAKNSEAPTRKKHLQPQKTILDIYQQKTLLQYWKRVSLLSILFILTHQGWYSLLIRKLSFEETNISYSSLEPTLTLWKARTPVPAGIK